MWSTPKKSASDQSQRFHKPEPEGEGKRAEERRQHHHRRGQCALMVHVPRHHIAAHGRGGAEHDENRHQLFGTEAERDRHRQKEHIEADELQERGAEGRSELPEGLLKVKHRAHGHQAERGAQRPDLAAGREQNLRLRNTEK